MSQNPHKALLSEHEDILANLFSPASKQFSLQNAHHDPNNYNLLPLDDGLSEADSFGHVKFHHDHNFFTNSVFGAGEV